MRRRVLVRYVGAAAAAAVAGCTEAGESGTPTRTTRPSPTSTETPTETTVDATDSPTESRTESATETNTPTETSEETETRTATDTATPTPSPDHTVRVGPNGTLAFDPSELTLATGETVEWVWDSNGHNVRPSSTPSGSDWTGTPGGDSETYDQGYNYRYTFTVTGEYDYYCAPHRQFGMTGSLTVE